MNTKLLARRMRIRFVALATWAVVVLLVLVLGAVNFFNLYRTNQEIDSILDVIVLHEGVMPQGTRFEGDSVLALNPEQAFQTRYFSVIYDEDGNIENIRLDHIAAITSEKAIEYGDLIRKGTRKSGTFVLDHAYYSFRCVQTESGKTMVVVLDSTRALTSLSIFRSSSFMFGMICTALYVLILTCLSKKVVSPFIRNMENQQQFITNAGHELKTPLAIISANTEVIEMMNGKSEWTESILAQVKRLSGLVGDLITLAKLGEKQDIVLSEVDFSAAASEVVRSFEPLASQEEKNLTYEIAENLKVTAEEKTLRELINILLDNAVKYCDDGGDIFLQLTPLRKGKGALLDVSNTYADGGNVDYSRFFERFYRGDVSHNSEKQGYGIGLSMAQELVKLYGGKISASYKDGRIHFTVAL